METVRIQNGQSEPIQTYLEADGSPATGLTDAYVTVRRLSDDYFLDWDDGTFKASGWAERQHLMSEVNAANAPGWYEATFDSTGYADDTYVVEVTCASADNVPQSGEIKVGDYVDNIDASIASRAAPGDAMDLVTDAVDAAAVATSGANEIRDSILSDGTAFPGARIDAAISTRSSHSAADAADAVWDEALAGHAAAGSAGEAQAHLDADVSTRSSHSAADVDTVLSAAHGSGSWAGASAAAVADAVWEELVADHYGTAGSAAEALAVIRGLVQQNFILDETTYNTSGLLTACRIRIYDSAANVPSTGGGSETTGLLATYNVTAVAESGNAERVDYYRAVKAP